jgi:carbon storage regulator
MLVLGRKTDESLIVGSDIVITILGIEGDRVKVGINAPKHITILRSEVRDRQLRAAAEQAGAPAAAPPRGH